jgi:hypothetical protein
MSSVPLQAVPFPDNTQFNDISLNIKTAIYDKNDVNKIYDHKGTYNITCSSYYDNKCLPYNAFNNTNKAYWKSNTIQNDYIFSPAVKPYTQSPYVISSTLVSPSVYQGGGSQSNNYFSTPIITSDESNSSDKIQTINGEWLQIQLPVQFTLSKYTLLTPPPQGSINYFPMEWTVAGSQDGTKWYFIQQQSLKKSIDVTKQTPVSFSLESNSSYSYYRLIITTMPPRTDIVRISQFGLFGLPTSKKESFVGMLNPQFTPANILLPSLNTFSNFSISEPMVSRGYVSINHNEGFSEPRSGIVGAPKELNLESRRDSLENPRSSIDVTKLRLVKSTEDENIDLLSYNDTYLPTNVNDNETLFVTALLTILVGTSIYILSIEFLR